MERTLGARFFEFEDTSTPDRVLVKTEKYSVPELLVGVVQTIGYITDFPKLKNNMASFFRRAQTIYPGGNTTLALINQYYGIESNKASSSQAAFAIGNQFDPADLTQYYKDQGLPADLPAIDAEGEPNFSYECKTDPNQCFESSLDLEVLSGVAQYAHTIFYKEDSNEQDYFYEFLVHVSALASPPPVLSISFGQDELEDTNGYDVLFNTEAQKLAARGISIVVSSGDDGVASYPARSNPALCGLTPVFPASSPWVTSVGVTCLPLFFWLSWF